MSTTPPPTLDRDNKQTDGAATRPWHDAMVLYQIYPRSFQDSNGDGVGDLKGILDRLPYVAALGVDAIWISPFVASPMRDFGYDVSDYCKVDPLFGTNADFDRLLEATHGAGLKMLVDMVLCHSSDQHAWFKESRSSRDNPKADWYVWADPKPDGTEPNNWMSIFGGRAWSWDNQRQQYYLHHFLPEQPNLNYHNPEVVAAALDACRFWLDKGVDGLRLDAIHTLTHDPSLADNLPAPKTDAMQGPVAMQDQESHQFEQPRGLEVLAELRALADSYDGDRYLVGEVGGPKSLDVTAKYTATDKLLHAAYNFSLLSFDVMPPQQMRQEVVRCLETIGADKIVYTTSNHDLPRVVGRLAGDGLSADQQSHLAAAVIAFETSLNGSACIYQGAELGMADGHVPFERMRDPFSIKYYPHFKGRDGARTPMPWQARAKHAGFSTAEPWLPIDDDHLKRAVDVQESDPNSPLHHVRTFLRWRKEQPALATHDIELLDSADELIVFLRRGDDQTLLCLFNLTATPLRHPLSADQINRAEVLGDSGFVVSLADDGIDIGPYAAGFVAMMD